MKLTDALVRNAKPTEKDRKLADGGGLFLLVKASGGKWWRLSYRYGGKQKTLSIGVYPDVSLREARERRDAARKILADGGDPGEHRKKQKKEQEERAAHTFEAVAREWFEVWRADKAAGQPAKSWAYFENDILPWIGKKPVREITAPVALEVLRRIENRGVSSTVVGKAKTRISQVMRFAIQKGLADRDPCPDLRGAFKKTEEKHMAAPTEPAKVGELLRALDSFSGSYVVSAALHLAPMLFVRPGELRAMRWRELDLDKGEWRFFVGKTKKDHLVPLPRQAVAIIRELQPITGDGEYVFRGMFDHSRPMSNMTLNVALRRLGFDTQVDITAHGFRAMARTLLHEKLHFPPEIIEHQLAHRVPDALGTAYNRTKFLPERRKMMQVWADYLDELKAGGKVIQFRGAA
ncbi:MAG: integrase arm-type DNA-binding domain-containing protein [Azoarcus sp.]|jgi:integrase|nr:integrase arm-type DNA-binding domain-containing protein [Azoarcus sp.]